MEKPNEKLNMGKGGSLLDAVILASECCNYLFTLTQLMTQLLTVPGFEEQAEGGVRATINRLVSQGKWKRLGTTGRGVVVIYCTDPKVIDLTIHVKVGTSISPDTTTEDMLEMIRDYINSVSSRNQEAVLNNRVNALQTALQSKAAEIEELKTAHRKEIEIGKTRYNKLRNSIQAIQT